MELEYILASGSPRRKELMEKLNIPFRVIVSDCEETLPEKTPAESAAEILAVRKAAQIAKAHPEAVVIGADTVVLLDGCILGKPKDRPDCENMLRGLSGRKHRVLTGVAIFHAGKSMSFTEETIVEFYPLTEEEIESYAQGEEPYDKAGGYGIQGQGALFVAGIQGDFWNVMGLPVPRLARTLKKFGLLGKF